MSPQSYVLIGLTAIVAALVGAMMFVVLRIISAARETRASLRGNSGETALLASALQEAVAKLKAQERFDNYRQLPPHASPLAQVIDECLAGRRPIVRRALRLSGPQGLASHLGVTVSPLFADAGELQGAICLFTDLTAVMDLEEQVRIKDSLARVGELTAGIAHEFRNGLATIHGYSRLIDLDAIPSTHRPYVEGIRAETQSLGEIVTNFLNFAKPTQLVVAPVDLTGIAERVADELRADARARG